MSAHVIKHSKIPGGRELELWCGADHIPFKRAFPSEMHVGLNVDGSIQPCKECLNAIRLEKEL